MTRLDRHVANVRNKLTLQIFIKALAWAAFWLCCAALLVILLDRLRVSVPRHGLLLWIGSGVSVACAIGYGIYRRPSKYAVAAAIDEALGLKEKFSTALYVRPSSDPFAMAAVRDAERAADNVSLYRRFPLRYPSAANFTAAAMVVTFLVAWLVPQMDPFGRAAAQKGAQAALVKQEGMKQALNQELPKVNDVAKAPINSDGIKMAQEALELLNHPTNDPARTSRTVLAKLQNAQEELKKTAETDVQYRMAEKNEELLKDLESAPDDGTPMSKVQNEIKDQQFDKAASDLQKAVEQFDKMDKKQQDQTIKQAATLAAALANAANNPQVQQQIQNQIQQITGNPQTAAALSKAMAQAAQGNPQAAQQVAKLAQQMQSQMNNGQGASPQQAAAIQKAVANMQAKANTQAQAQAMSQAAQQLAMAMQGAQQGTQAGAQAKSGGQSAQAGKSGGQQAGQQPGQGNQQANGNQAQGGQPSQQQMAGAQQNLQQQLQQMQSAQKDAQEMAAAQQAAQDAANQAANGAGNDGQGQGAQANGNGAQGQGRGQGNNPGQNQQQGNGQGMGGVGGPGSVVVAPATFTKAIDPTLDQEKGKMLAVRQVKADIEAGKSTADIQAVTEKQEKESEDDIDKDRIPKESQKTVREYFTNLQKQ